MKKALFGGAYDDYGPCSCGENRATVPVAMPVTWTEEEEEEIYAVWVRENFPFATGYDFRRCFGAVQRGDYYLNFSACPDCCRRAAELGIAEEVEDVGFSSNVLVTSLLAIVANNLGIKEE